MRRRKPRIYDAPMAVASDGTILINVAHVEDERDVAKLVERAAAEGHVFIGVGLTARECSRIKKPIDDALAEIVACTWGRRRSP